MGMVNFIENWFVNSKHQWITKRQEKREKYYTEGDSLGFIRYYFSRLFIGYVIHLSKVCNRQ
jgi:hypothetical protein